MSEQIGIKPALPHNLLLANQTVLKRIAVDPLGDRYTVLFGTTNRIYDINVAYGPDAPITLADFEAYLSRTSHLRHPCLIAYFACGENENVTWIRSEHSEGVPDWVTASAYLIAPHAKEEEIKDVFFPTVQTLIDASDRKIAQKDCNHIIGDLAEAIAYLHKHNSHAGILTPETVFLNKTIKQNELIARLRFYAWPKATTPECQANDLRQAADFILLLLTVSESKRPARLNKALTDFAQTLKNAEKTIDGQAFYETICEIFEENGAFHTPRLEKNPPLGFAPDSESQSLITSDTASQNRVRQRSPRRRYRHKQGKKRFDANSATGQMVIAIIHTGLMFAGIAGTGIGVYFGMRYLDERQRKNTLISSSERYSAISIIEDEAEQAEKAQLPADIRDYTLEQLQFASGTGNATATARLAVLTLAENPADADIRAEAASVLSPHISRLEVAAINDPVAAYWCGYVKLLGLDADAAADAAVEYLNQAVNKDFTDAHILLGDRLAAGPSDAAQENDRLAMQHWKAAYGRPTQWTSTQTDAIARMIAFIRFRRGFKPDDDELGELILHAATAGYLDAMLLVSECYDSGLLVKEAPSTALFWLRRIAAHASATDVVRAEAQRRMADMFAEGRGTPPSLSAARIWYERAAKLGNQKAMLTLAEYCDTGRGTEDNKQTPREAQYWRDQARSAQPPPPIILPSRLRLQSAPAIKSDATNGQQSNQHSISELGAATERSSINKGLIQKEPPE